MNLSEIDFNTLYKKQKNETSFIHKTKDDWDAKAKDLNEKIHQSIYNEEFLARVDTKECTSLLDIGCGPGNLALRFAKKLETIYAMDYSKEMLKLVEHNAHSKHIDNIQTIHASWNDDWDAIPKADIVVASRSLEVDDLYDALSKLSQKAQKRVYVTYAVGDGFFEKDIFSTIGRTAIEKPDYIYVVNMLYQLGIHPRIDYIESENKRHHFHDFDEFKTHVEWHIGALNDEEAQRLATHFEKTKHTTKQTVSSIWAMLSWETA